MKRLLSVISFALFTLVLGAQTSIQVQTHKVVSENEQFNVTFIMEGESKATDFNWAPGDGFQLLWGPQQGHSTNMQIVNGKMSKSVQTTYSYVLRPMGTGKFVLPRASAKVKGKEIYSESVTVEVVADKGGQSAPSAGSAGSNRQNASGDDIFLDIELSRKNVVVGEPITAVIRLYQRVNIAGFESAKFPDFNGFWSQELEAPTNIEFSRSTYNGQIYNSALLRKFVLIPQQQGTMTIDPAELVCLVNVRVSSGMPSIFDGFFDDHTTVRRNVVSKPVSVKVSPLPAGAPSGFGGGVGKFSISAGISKDSLKLHEAASLVVTVSGTGNIPLISAPKVSFPPDMEVYDTKVSEKIDASGISGSKTYEFPFIPRSYGDFEIAPVSYPYYDVKSGKYVMLSTGPIAFHVERGSEPDAAGVPLVRGVAQKDVRNLADDIRFINVRNHGLSSKGYFLVGSPLYPISLVVILLVAAVLWVALRKLAVRRADVAGAKNRKAVRMAMKRLKVAGTFLRQNLYTAFYEELHKSLLCFLSDKLNVPVAELSKERISEELSAGGVDRTCSDDFISLLDACEFARYAPSAGHEAMSVHYKSAIELISSIDSGMNTSRSTRKAVMMSLAVFMILPFTADAEEDYADSLWNAANQAYTSGEWQEAIDGYQKLSDASLESAALWCNMGNAWYKEGNVARAVLCYERALKLDPSYTDARYNLAFLNQQIQDRIEQVPEFILTTWMRKLCYVMDSDSWAVLSLVFFAVSLGLILLFLLGSGVAARRSGFFTAIVTILVSVGAFAFSLWQRNDYMRSDTAVVMRPVSSVKSSPSNETAKDLFVLHEGTKVKVIDSVGAWRNIELADGRQGWVPSGDIENI